MTAGAEQILDGAMLECFARELAAAPRQWRDRLGGLAGEREYAVIWSDERVNAWVIRWTGEADTGFHDHDISGSGIVVVEGALIEERLTIGGPPIARRYRAGDSFHLAASTIHRVRGAAEPGAPAALTVHAYSPPLRAQGVYRTAADGSLERSAIPHTEELRARAAPVGV